MLPHKTKEPGDDSVPSGAPRRPRVLVISHLFPSVAAPGAGIFVKEQVDALSRDADVTVVVGRYGPVEQPSPGARVVEVSLGRSSVSSGLGVALGFPAYRRAALRVARAAGPFDVIHAHYGFPDGVVGVTLGRALAVPVVVTLHGSDFEHQLLRPVAGPAIGRSLARADRIVAVAPHIAEGMRERFALDDDRVVFLPNGYNEDEIHRHETRQPRYFLFVGALDPRKRADLLIEAFATVRDRVGLDIVVVGDGAELPSLREQAVRLGVADRVRFEGHRGHAEIDGYLAGAAALVLPSEREGMPIVVNEALASGTPVVATRLPGTAWQVRDPRFGRLVERGDAAALAEALVETAETRWDYAAIARDCGVPTWSAYAKQLLALYAGIAPGVAGPSDRLEAAGV